MKLLQQFILNALDRPNDIYLKDDKSELTYQEVSNRIQNLRYLLREKGMSTDSKIIILSSNENSFVISLLAILMEGGIAVPISLESKKTEIETILSESKSIAIIGPQFYYEKLTNATNFNQVLFIPTESFMIENHIDSSYRENEFSTVECDENRISLILFTSGSEGIPKGVCHSNHSLFFMTDVCANDFWNITRNDKMLMVSPSQTLFGILTTLVSAITGSELRLLSSFTPQLFIKTLVEDKITFFAGVPTLAELMLKLKDRIPVSELHLKKILIAGAPLAELTEKKAENIFGIKIITGYGMTEGVPMAYRNEFELDYPNRTVGKISRGCEIIFADESNQPVLINKEGEIMVKGDQIFNGYLKNGDVDLSCFDNGWFRTGDIGKIDENGYLFINGRVSDMIKRSGFRVFPAEIENAMMKIDGITECSVIGINDQSRGEKIIAFITCQKRCKENEIIMELKKSLSSYKIPNEVIILDEIPKTIAGKTNKLLLKEKYLNS